MGYKYTVVSHRESMHITCEYRNVESVVKIQESYGWSWDNASEFYRGKYLASTEVSLYFSKNLEGCNEG